MAPRGSTGDEQGERHFRCPHGERDLKAEMLALL
jgi:hypothetical protein